MNTSDASTTALPTVNAIEADCAQFWTLARRAGSAYVEKILQRQVLEGLRAQLDPVHSELATALTRLVDHACIGLDTFQMRKKIKDIVRYLRVNPSGNHRMALDRDEIECNIVAYLATLAQYANFPNWGRWVADICAEVGLMPATHVGQRLTDPKDPEKVEKDIENLRYAVDFAEGATLPQTHLDFIRASSPVELRGKDLAAAIKARRNRSDVQDRERAILDGVYFDGLNLDQL